jgi:hypothetical protein
MTIININCCPVATQKPLSSSTPAPTITPTVSLTPTITKTNTPTPTTTITSTPAGACTSVENTICLPLERSLVYSDGATLKRVSNDFVTIGQSLNFSVRGCVACANFDNRCISDARGLYGTPNTFIGNYNAVFGVISATNSPSIPFTTTNAFYIGMGANIIATSAGHVYCGIWDAGTWGDNIGNYCVYLQVAVV